MAVQEAVGKCAQKKRETRPPIVQHFVWPVRLPREEERDFLKDTTVCVPVV